MFNKICIIGIGLIGGSIARAAREQGLANNIVAYGRKSGIDNLGGGQAGRVRPVLHEPVP